MRHGFAQRSQDFPRLPQEPARQIETAGAADAAGGPAHQLHVDRIHQFAEAGGGLEASGSPRGRLDSVEPEDLRHDKALRFQFPSPVVPDVGIARGMGLHEQQRPARGEGGHLAGDDPRPVLLRG